MIVSMISKLPALMEQHISKIFEAFGIFLLLDRPVCRIPRRSRHGDMRAAMLFITTKRI